MDFSFSKLASGKKLINSEELKNAVNEIQNNNSYINQKKHYHPDILKPEDVSIHFRKRWSIKTG